MSLMPVYKQEKHAETITACKILMSKSCVEVPTKPPQTSPSQKERKKKRNESEEQFNCCQVKLVSKYATTLPSL